MKFLHTSDWQMGMKADSVGLMAERVRAERLEAAKRVAGRSSATQRGSVAVRISNRWVCG